VLSSTMQFRDRCDFMKIGKRIDFPNRMGDSLTVLKNRCVIYKVIVHINKYGRHATLYAAKSAG